MTFFVKTAYIGPYLISTLRGEIGEMQKMRYKVPVTGILVAQGSFVISGKLRASWSGSPDAIQEFGVGSHLATDRFSFPRPLTLNEELTLTALENDSTYVCVAAVGIEQYVDIKRVCLAAGDQVTVNRFDLLLIGGGDSAVRIDGGEVKTGPRLVYARTRDLVIKAEKDTILGMASLAG